MNWSRPRAGPETRAETREQEPELSWACKLNWSRPQAGPATDRSPHNQTDGTGSWNGTQNKRGPKQLSWSRGGTGRARQGCPQPGAGPRAGQAAASASAQAARLLPGGSAAPGVAGLLRPSVRPCTGRDAGQSYCAHRAPELLPPLQTLLPPGHGRLCPALSAAAPRCRAPATGGEGRERRGRDPSNVPFLPGRAGESQGLAETLPHTAAAAAAAVAQTNNQQPPGLGPAPHQCRRRLGRTPTAPAPAPPNVRPRLGVGCGDGNRGTPRPPPAPTNSHGPQGEPAQWAQAAAHRAELPPALPCRCREPSFPPKAARGALPGDGTHSPRPSAAPPAGQGAKPTCPEHKTAPRAAARPGSLAPARSTAAPGTPLPRPGTGPPPAPPSPGTLQGPGPSCSTGDPRRHSRPRELSTPLPPRSSARPPPPRGTHLTGHVLAAGVPRRSPPRGCAPRPGTGMSLPHASAQPRGIACAANASQRTGGTAMAVAARARPGRLHRLTRGAAGAGVGPCSGLCSQHSTL